jgi:chemotaxis protein methyltransferase CheR
MIHRSVYIYFQEFIKIHAGFDLSEGKDYFIDGHLAPVLKKYHFSDLSSLVEALKLHKNKELEVDCVEAFMVHESLFFRDKTLFDLLENTLIPQIFETKRSQPRATFRMWSAGCSTGQEPYSLAFLCTELKKKAPHVHVQIVATDLSNVALNKAKNGAYNQFEVQRGLPIRMLTTYFDHADPQWIVKPVIKQIIRFEQLNLLNSFSHLGTFDLIFCRNVLIYLETNIRADIVSRMTNALHHDGLIILGSAEVGSNLSPHIHHSSFGRSIYTKSGS